MQHVAILQKRWNLAGKILSGQKTIESRWYKNRVAPWGRIQMGQTIFFKETGQPVRLAATVEGVVEIGNLTPVLVAKLLEQYGQRLGIEKDELPAYVERFKDKNYCLLIFLHSPREVPPFNIDKRGFGSASAWLCVESVESIKQDLG